MVEVADSGFLSIPFARPASDDLLEVCWLLRLEVDLFFRTQRHIVQNIAQQLHRNRAPTTTAAHTQSGTVASVSPTVVWSLGLSFVGRVASVVLVGTALDLDVGVPVGAGTNAALDVRLGMLLESVSVIGMGLDVGTSGLGAEAMLDVRMGLDVGTLLDAGTSAALDAEAVLMGLDVGTLLDAALDVGVAGRILVC